MSGIEWSNCIRMPSIFFLCYSVVRDSDELAMESSDVRVNLKRKFLVEMPEDFYQFWDLCKQLNPSHPDGNIHTRVNALYSTLYIITACEEYYLCLSRIPPPSQISQKSSMVHICVIKTLLETNCALETV